MMLKYARQSFKNDEIFLISVFSPCSTSPYEPCLNIMLIRRLIELPDTTESQPARKSIYSHSSNRYSTLHNHAYFTIIETSHKHQHAISGTTGPAIASGNGHVHRIHIRTTFDARNSQPHWHSINKLTGPAIDLPDDEHTHYFSGETSYELGHQHRFSSVTDSSPAEEWEDHSSDD